MMTSYVFLYFITLSDISFYAYQLIIFTDRLLEAGVRWVVGCGLWVVGGGPPPPVGGVGGAVAYFLPWSQS
jgi:hypothetical protein